MIKKRARVAGESLMAVARYAGSNFLQRSLGLAPPGFMFHPLLGLKHLWGHDVASQFPYFIGDIHQELLSNEHIQH